jgi:23S rRNA (adenine-N6)-dimethyltransferase
VSAAPRTWWGWHQLADRWARRLVEQSDLTPHDLVLDIGAGTGAITRHLASTGARVIAVEAHPRRAAQLRETFAGRRVKVVQADASDLRLPTRPFVVVANPPFAITTALLRRLLSRHSCLRSARLIVPRHVAVRWSQGRAPGAHRWSRTFALSIDARVPRSAFRPPPSDDAVVLHIARRR